MGRRAKTRMKILDIKVESGKCIVAVEIKRKTNVWKRAYGFNAAFLDKWDFETFKLRVLEDSKTLIEDQEFNDRVLMRIEEFVDKEIILD